MMIEVLGTRILGPFYGVSLFVWSSLISVTLIALALGYYLGGIAADRAKRFQLSHGIALDGTDSRDQDPGFTPGQRPGRSGWSLHQRPAAFFRAPPAAGHGRAPWHPVVYEPAGECGPVLRLGLCLQHRGQRPGHAGAGILPAAHDGDAEHPSMG